MMRERPWREGWRPSLPQPMPRVESRYCWTRCRHFWRWLTPSTRQHHLSFSLMILAFSISIHFSLTKCSLISSIATGSLYGFDGSKSSGGDSSNSNPFFLPIFHTLKLSYHSLRLSLSLSLCHSPHLKYVNAVCEFGQWLVGFLGFFYFYF